jgi:thiazole/oxazole-forming peptide maturase SagD family component
MNKDSKPLVILFGSFKDDALIFVGRQGYLEWTWLPSLFSEILMHCNGMNTIFEIAKLLGSKNSQLLKMLNEAEQYGIVSDSTKLSYQFHQDSSNPTMFSTDLSSAEVETLHSERLDWRNDGEEQYIIPQTQASLLTELFKGRRSCRKFSSKEMALEMLIDLLGHLYSKESVPSAGDLRPIMPYVYLFRQVESLPTGLYEYHWAESKLVRLKEQPTLHSLYRAFPEESLFFNSQCLLIYVADLNRESAKYSNRGYRNVFLEAGHCAQNIYLWGAKSNYGVLEYGGYLDKELQQSLALKAGQVIATTLFIGEPAEENSSMIITSRESLEKISSEPLLRNGVVKYPSLLSFQDQISDRSYSVAGYKLDQNSQEEFAWGNGANLYEAKLKAAVEGLERFYSSKMKVHRDCSAENLSGDWLDPRSVTPLSLKQYKLHCNLQPFKTDERWQWVKGIQLKSNRRVFVPIDLVYFPIEPKKYNRKLCTYATSSGVAAHVTRDRAIESALMELIERDAFVKAWYIGLEGSTAIDAEQHCQTIAGYVRNYAKRGTQVCFVKLPSLYGANVIVCMMRKEGGLTRFGIGAGVDFTKIELALQKAFYEAEFVWLTAPEKVKLVRSAKKVVSVADHLGYFQTSKRLRLLDNWFDLQVEKVVPSSDSIDNYDPIVVDLYQSPALCVVRVIEPSLVPMSFGFGLEHYLHKGFALRLSGLKYTYPGKPHCFA